MLIQRAYKTELDPTPAQRETFKRYADAARFIFNWGLGKRIELYEAEKKSISLYDQSKEIVRLKASGELAWLLEISNRVPRWALRSVDDAFKNFFRRIKKGGNGKPGFPRFKSWRDHIQKFKLDRCIRVTLSAIRLPRIGWVKLKEKSYLPGHVKINSATVSSQAGRWFVSIQVELEHTIPPPNPDHDISIHLDFSPEFNPYYLTSDGQKLDPCKPLERALRRLRKLSRRHQRKVMDSKNRDKARQRLAKLHWRIAEKRKDFLHKATTRLAKNYSIITVEKPDLERMLQHAPTPIARATADAAFGEFVRQLTYKTKWYGSELKII